MAVNKVVYGSETLIDLTADTATSGTVLEGYTLHLANGQQATGSFKMAQKSFYGTCATAAATQAKVVVCSDFALSDYDDNPILYVKMTNNQTYNGGVTLNVNSTGAKNVARIGSTTSGERYYWLAGELVAFVYDGTNWLMLEAGLARFFMDFTQKESCGKCVPCREGTKRMLEILNRIVDGKGEDGDIELLKELGEAISKTALCGLGKTAAGPVLSTIKYFEDEYRAHIYDKKCPAGACQKLKTISIDPEICKGCSKCARNCPVGAIKGEIKKPFVIDQKLCIKCGACLSSCPFKAIKEN